MRCITITSEQVERRIRFLFRLTDEVVRSRPELFGLLPGHFGCNSMTTTWSIKFSEKLYFNELRLDIDRDRGARWKDSVTGGIPRRLYLDAVGSRAADHPKGAIHECQI